MPTVFPSLSFIGIYFASWGLFKTLASPMNSWPCFITRSVISCEAVVPIARLPVSSITDVVTLSFNGTVA